jgi:nitrogen fixation/metabolism regulation signal transduction histidine kinase
MSDPHPGPSGAPGPSGPPAPAESRGGLIERLLPFEGRMMVLVLLAALPGTAVAGFFLVRRWDGWLGWGLAGLLALFALGVAVVLERRLSYTLHTLSNLLEAIRREDFALRPRASFGQGAMGEVMREVALLPEQLRSQRLEVMEATALLSRVIDAIDVAVFAFDRDAHLELVNRSGERLFGRPPGTLHGQTAADLGLADFLVGEPNRLVDRSFPGRAARWDVRRSGFRKDGLPYRLVVLSDLSRPLREEERQAWKRLIRVLGHELNNSLAPIRSIADTLARLLDRDPRPADWDDDARRSLALISERSEALSRFMSAYARLARLPPPTLRPAPLAPVVRRAVGIEARLPVEVEPGPDVTVSMDPDQVEQALINLIQNAADASLEAHGADTVPPLRVGWRVTSGGAEVWVKDSGLGLSNPDNLFVPFYTTKPEGSGIGLVLARQVAEAHGGTVSLENRREGGCLARFRLTG